MIRSARSRLRPPSSYEAFAIALAFLALGGSSIAAPVRDAASRLITGKQVKNGSLSEKDLSSKARAVLRGSTGPAGQDGAPGPVGPVGQTGPTGPEGADGSPGADGQDGQDGQSFMWRDEFDPGASYSAGDAVGYDGSAWMATAPSQGQNPPEHASLWSLMARRGEQGEPGENGQDGSPDTGSQILSKLLGVDGSGSGLDSDLLDGMTSTDFLRATAKAADADKLDGKDSTEFAPGISGKAVDADKLDGLDSSALRSNSCPSGYVSDGARCWENIDDQVASLADAANHCRLEGAGARLPTLEEFMSVMKSGVTLGNGGAMGDWTSSSVDDGMTIYIDNDTNANNPDGVWANTYALGFARCVRPFVNALGSP